MPKLANQIDMPLLPQETEKYPEWIRAFTDRLQRAWRTLTYTTNALSQADTLANRPSTPVLDHSFYTATDTSVTYVGINGAWRVIGSFGGTVSTVTTTYTADGEDSVVLANATGAAFTITLPAAATFAHRMFAFIKTDASANAVTIDGAGAETINGAATASLAAQYNGITIVSNGTAWFIVP